MTDRTDSHLHQPRRWHIVRRKPLVLLLAAGLMLGAFAFAQRPAGASARDDLCSEDPFAPGSDPCMDDPLSPACDASFASFASFAKETGRNRVTVAG